MTTIVAIVAAMASKNNTMDTIFSFLFILKATFAQNNIILQSRQVDVKPKQSANQVI